MRFFFLYLSAHCARYKIGCIKALNSIEVSYRSHRCKQLDSTCTNSNERFHNCGISNKTKNEQTIRRTKCLLYQTNHRECDIGRKTVALEASVHSAFMCTVLLVANKPNIWYCLQFFEWGYKNNKENEENIYGESHALEIRLW